MEFEECLYEWPESAMLIEVLNARPPKLEQCYTMPGIKAGVLLNDAMASALQQQLNKTVNRPTVSKDIDGIRQLIAAGHLRAAVNMTSSLLTDLQQGHGMAGQASRNTQQSLELWACRLQLLMALKMYTLLNDELIEFGNMDAPDLYFQYYPNIYTNGFKGSMVPFSMRLMHSEAPRFSQYPWVALERINTLEHNVRQVLSKFVEKGLSAANIWSQRLLAVQKMRARTLYFLKEYTMSIILYNRLSQLESEDQFFLKLMLLRLAIAIGDERKMEYYLKQLSSLAGDSLVLHKSLKSVFYGNYAQALDFLQPTVRNSPLSEVHNNTAICMLYRGKILDAMELLENAPGTPNEPTAINFYTIAELAAPGFAQKNLSSYTQRLDGLPDMFDPAVVKIGTV